MSDVNNIHKKNLPVHGSMKSIQVADTFDVPAEYEDDEMNENDDELNEEEDCEMNENDDEDELNEEEYEMNENDHLPTHSSDASNEIPDSLEGKVGERPTKKELDDTKMGHEIPENYDIEDDVDKELDEMNSDEDEMDESEEKDDEQLDEGIVNLFKGKQLTEKFKSKLNLVFEAALNEKVKTQRKQIRKAYSSATEKRVNLIKESLVDQLELYIDHITEEWVKVNKVAIEQNIKTEITENFIVGLKSLFSENYVEIPKTKRNLYSEMQKDLKETKIELHKALNEKKKLKESLRSQRKSNLIKEHSTDLTESQKEKFNSLTENVKYINKKDFTNKLKTLKSSFFKSKLGKRMNNEQLFEEKGLKNPEKSKESSQNDEVDFYVNKFV